MDMCFSHQILSSQIDEHESHLLNPVDFIPISNDYFFGFLEESISKTILMSIKQINNSQ